ncbi:LOW QUALITY PROTEIN: hypothetical protein RJ640_020171 [Escallonia rubra]|uniref:CCHC-type domain-containing protein n=1 Tax=Escallonia rubra TaxID=112253 RepID=A0AA88QX32_9ASTE|nr:LOW QUALITY PROTEIN: hypothetical protein RJ640_020171 [Escallonia rubra]
MATIISKTNHLIFEDSIDMEEDADNANREYIITLLAKLISNKKSILKVVQNILSKAWNPSKGMKITLLEDNTFCIALNHKWDRARILESRPWSIMSSHLVVRDWPPNLTMISNFHSSGICGLPPNQMAKLNAEKIVEKIGKLRAVDFTSNINISWLKFLKIRVDLDIRNPLHTDLNRKKDDQSKAWIPLQYERLPDFYFNCGRLGHVTRSCPNPPLEIPAHLSNPYGPWLRTGYSEAIPPEVE